MQTKIKQRRSFNGIEAAIITRLINTYGTNYTTMSQMAGYSLTKLVRAINLYLRHTNSAAAISQATSLQGKNRIVHPALELTDLQLQYAFPHYATVPNTETVRATERWKGYYTPIEAHFCIGLPQLLELQHKGRLKAFTRLLMLYCEKQGIVFLDIETTENDNTFSEIPSSKKSLLMFPLNVIKELARNTVVMGRLRKGSEANNELENLLKEVLF
jgi:hypothetical protein